MRSAPAAARRRLRQVFAVSNYILKYSRDERVKYISHLDFVRLFHRAVRRTDLQFMFSQGFNPHPIMTVAQPLSVGVTADGEYMKVGFDGNYSDDKIKDTINAALPLGYKIIAVKKVEGKEIDLTKLDRAVYTVEAEAEGEFDAEKFLENKELIVPKKTKSGVKDSDIRPYIYDLQVESCENGVIVFKMTVAAGSAYNLKPDTVIDAINKYADDFNVGFFKVHRNAMLRGDVDYL